MIHCSNAVKKQFYSTRKWKRVRLSQLRDKPLCEICDRLGIVTVATVVDHIIGHNGVGSISSTHTDNLMSVCNAHHLTITWAERRGDYDGITLIETREAKLSSGVDSRLDSDGYPIDEEKYRESVEIVKRAGVVIDHDEELTALDGVGNISI